MRFGHVEPDSICVAACIVCGFYISLLCLVTEGIPGRIRHVPMQTFYE